MLPASTASKHSITFCNLHQLTFCYYSGMGHWAGDDICPMKALRGEDGAAGGAGAGQAAAGRAQDGN